MRGTSQLAAHWISFLVLARLHGMFKDKGAELPQAWTEASKVSSARKELAPTDIKELQVRAIENRLRDLKRANGGKVVEADRDEFQTFRTADRGGGLGLRYPFPLSLTSITPPHPYPNPTLASDITAT